MMRKIYSWLLIMSHKLWDCEMWARENRVTAFYAKGGGAKYRLWGVVADAFSWGWQSIDKILIASERR